MAIRWSGLLLAAGMLASGRWVEAAVAMLVALAQVIAWRSALPRPWETLLSLTALVAAISSYLDLYARITWWDVPVHLVLTGALAVLAGWVLRREEVRPWQIVLGGVVLAIIWELMEQWGHARVDDRIHVTPGDTAGDITAGVVGSLLAAWLFTRRGAHDRP